MKKINFVLSAKTLLKIIEYDFENNNFIEKISVKIRRQIQDVLYHTGFIFVITKKSLIKYSLQLEKIKEIKFIAIGTFVKCNEYIILAADGFTIIYDVNLNEKNKVKLLSRKELDLANTDYSEQEIKEFECKKNVDKIILYNNTAYMVDNIVKPLWIFKYDVCNIPDITLQCKYKFETVNGWAQAHTLCPDLNKWLIIEECHHMGGWGQYVYYLPLNSIVHNNKLQGIGLCFNHNAEIEKMPVLKHDDIIQQNTNDKYYCRIKCINSITPHWAIITSLYNESYLAKVEFFNNKIVISHFQYLGKFEHYVKPNIYVYGNCCFIFYYTEKDTLNPEKQILERNQKVIFAIYEVSGYPKLINEYRLNEFNDLQDEKVRFDIIGMEK